MSESEVSSSSQPGGTAAFELNRLLVGAGLERISEEAVIRFGVYLELILRWNDRTNLTAVRDRDGILSRHFVECIACAQVLPIETGSLLDYGSGAGFPGIPIAICRPQLQVTLAESQNKKAAFLNEVVRVLGLSSRVYGKRAEELSEQFDCVVLRAVDQMERAISLAALLVRSEGFLVLMSTEDESNRHSGAAGEGFKWDEPFRLPGSDRRVLLIGRKIG